MNRLTMVVSALAVVAVMPTSSATLAAPGPCPQSCVGRDTAYTQCSTAAVKDTVFNSNCYGSAAHGSVHYNLVAGTASTYSDGGSDCGISSAVVARDTYMLVGPPGIVSFTASIHVYGGGDVSGAYAEGAVEAHITDSQAKAASSWYLGGGPPGAPSSISINQDLSIMESRSSGDSFPLTIQLASDAGGGSANVTSTLSFPGLPPAYSIVSCQGYVSGGPLPAHRTSWGALKAAYR